MNRGTPPMFKSVTKIRTRILVMHIMITGFLFCGNLYKLHSGKWWAKSPPYKTRILGMHTMITDFSFCDNLYG